MCFLLHKFLKTLRKKLGLSNFCHDFSKNIEKVWNIEKINAKMTKSQLFSMFKFLDGQASILVCIAIIEIAHSRTCIQWLWLQLSSALGSQIFGFRTLNIPWPLGGAIKVVVRYFLIEKSSLLYTIIEYIIDSRIKKIPR